jgi:ActR/RegA family two-component response regulator
MTEILLIAVSEQRDRLARLLRDAGYEVLVADSANAASDILHTRAPSLMISEIRLGPFNGLHVLIRHQLTHPRMRAIFLDRVYDPVLAADAHRLGASYLGQLGEDATLLEHVALEIQSVTQEQETASATPRRRWPRQTPTQELVVRIEEAPARVVDVSYGGLRLEIADGSAIRQPLRIAFPDYGKSFLARPVWSHPAAAGRIWCGAELFGGSAAAEQEWRRLVDSVRRS